MNESDKKKKIYFASVYRYSLGIEKASDNSHGELVRDYIR